MRNSAQGQLLVPISKYPYLAWHVHAAYIHTYIHTYLHTYRERRGGEGRRREENIYTLDETGGRDDRADHIYKPQESISVTVRVTKLGNYQCYKSS